VIVCTNLLRVKVLVNTEVEDSPNEEIDSHEHEGKEEIA
jgi:hypothetical protein